MEKLRRKMTLEMRQELTMKLKARKFVMTRTSPSLTVSHVRQVSAQKENKIAQIGVKSVKLTVRHSVYR